jgi:hypothetical protein
MTNLKIGYLHMLCFFLVVVLVTFALVGSFFSMILITPITIAYLIHNKLAQYGVLNKKFNIIGLVGIIFTNLTFPFFKNYDSFSSLLEW